MTIRRKLRALDRLARDADDEAIERILEQAVVQVKRVLEYRAQINLITSAESYADDQSSNAELLDRVQKFRDTKGLPEEADE